MIAVLSIRTRAPQLRGGVADVAFGSEFSHLPMGRLIKCRTIHFGLFGACAQHVCIGIVVT